MMQEEPLAELPLDGGAQDSASSLYGHRPHRRVFASTSSLFLANAAIALLGTIALHQMTHSLGAAGYGVFVSVLNLISTSMLFADLGINTYSGREIARDKTQAASVLGLNLGLRLVLSLVTIPIVVGVGLAIYANGDFHLRLGLVLVALAIPFEALRAVSLSYYVATIQNYKTALLSLVQQLIYVSGVVVALQFGFGLVGCFVAYVTGVAMTGLIAYFAVRRSVRFVPRASLASWRHILRQSLSIGSIQVVNVLYLRTNILLLSIMTTFHTVAQYAVAAAIVTFLLVIPNAYMTSMLPLLVKSQLDGLTSLVNTCVAYMAMIGVVAVAGTVCLGGGLVHLLAGASFTEAVPILSILSLSVLFTCITSVFAYASFARDHHHRLLGISVMGLVMNILLDVALIPSMGARGASIATVVVELLILVGTYAIFRTRVGAHFTAFGRLARTFLAGAIATVSGRLLFGPTTSTRYVVLGVEGVALLVFLAVLFALLRCFPTRLAVMPTIRSGLGFVRGRSGRAHHAPGDGTR